MKRLAAFVAAACALAALPVAAGHLRDFTPATPQALRERFAGKPFVLAFWSVHCEPCMREMALWKKLGARHPRVAVVLVATDPPAERERIGNFLRRYDPGPVERWAFADEMEERVRYAVDPRWRGELPRTYFFDAAHRSEARSGLLDEAWTEGWLRRASAR
jgi:thiol-disulfide isomerase/thioredoxin